MTDRPTEKIATLYPELEVDVSYFPAFWYIMSVSHLTGTDVDRLCRPHGLSIADMELIGGLWTNRPTPLRATDLAQRLCVSNAVLSSRVAKLESNGFITCTSSTTDRRAIDLHLERKGVDAFETFVKEADTQGRFVQCYRRLSEQDRSDLERIMGELHTQLYRDFTSRSRGDH